MYALGLVILTIIFLVITIIFIPLIIIMRKHQDKNIVILIKYFLISLQIIAFIIFFIVFFTTPLEKESTATWLESRTYNDYEMNVNSWLIALWLFHLFLLIVIIFSGNGFRNLLNFKSISFIALIGNIIILLALFYLEIFKTYSHGTGTGG